MVILRGLSGSGKSTLCERIKTELTAAGVQVDVASADHFFQQPNGQYKFDRALLPDAHDASHKECERLCAGGHIQVVSWGLSIDRSIDRLIDTFIDILVVFIIFLADYHR